MLNDYVKTLNLVLYMGSNYMFEVYSLDIKTIILRHKTLLKHFAVLFKGM